MIRVALVTCRELPEPDVDEDILLAACSEAGLSAEYVAWDDAAVNWSAYGGAVVRSTWNYYEDEPAFRRWISDTAHVTALLNPPPLMLRTLDKHYLAELGVPVVPTRYIDRFSPAPLTRVLEETGWTQFVLKPTVSAGSYMTHAFGPEDMEEAEQFLAGILRDRDAMVQKYLARVANGGEIALVHVEGKLTHGVVKQPRFHDGEESVSPAVQPDALQRRAAEIVMATVHEPWLYARVDLMQDDDGAWLLSELEVIEPSLYLVQLPQAATLLALAIRKWLLR
jgi:hypothetical protein